jgi:hypothetical protein
MSYSSTKELTDIITGRLAKYNIQTKVHHSCKSESTYIKIGREVTIRVSSHHSGNDFRCQYNIGDHITRFKRDRKSYYYRADRVNELIKRILKDLKDNRML